MTDRIIADNVSSVGASTVTLLNDGDNVAVNPGISVSASGAAASGIYSTASSHSVTLSTAAIVSSETATGISLGGTGGHSLIISQLAQVFGYNQGIALYGSQNVLRNAGSITGHEIGARVGSAGSLGNQIFQSGSIMGTTRYGLLVNGDSLIHNTGLIQGGMGGIFAGNASATVINNYGTIVGGTGDAIYVGSGFASVNNSGRIEGSIYFDGNADDLYEGRNGTVTGFVYLGKGNDRAYGGVGAEIFHRAEGNDTIDGGGGADVAVFSGARSDYTITANPDRSFTITDQRAIAGNDGTDLLKNIRSVKFADATFALSFNLTGTSANNTLLGGWGNDTLSGLAGNDRLLGEQGNDTLIGGTGMDTLTGGTGRDVFVFNTRPSKTTNLDRITDFNVADDTIHLARSVFSKISTPGTLAKSAFWTGDKAHDSDDRIIYNKTTGALFYDGDGSGTNMAAVQFATIAKYLKITEKDFYVI